ncbi:hypothetical protein GCM10010531_27200 [Blastococcus jejuensis]|uniref:Carboxylesterase family protein n=1 Tax=Blastococcus jejuensis TaxID=351224 RepID=A0ABP6PAT0_9ACTN
MEPIVEVRPGGSGARTSHRPPGPAPPQHLADVMHAAWVAFATTGWPRYELERRTTMRFDLTPAVDDDPRAAVRSVWDAVR